MSAFWANPFFLVSLGGVLGCNARYLIGHWFRAQTWAGDFPWGTLFVNVSGSFAIGLAAGLLLERSVPLQQSWYLLLGTGFCGGYTTFSAFELEVLELIREDRWLLALGYVAGSLLVGFAAVVAGVKLGETIR